MSQTINVLFLAAEAEPFVKVGGLGDVSGTLPRALRALSNDEIILDVRLVLPMHSVIKAESLKPVSIYSIPRGKAEVQADTFEGSLEGMPVYFINGDPIRASGSVYSSNNKLDAEKYVFFALAALELPRQINWNPNVMHCNDWHTAFAPLLLGHSPRNVGLSGFVISRISTELSKSVVKKARLPRMATSIQYAGSG